MKLKDFIRDVNSYDPKNHDSRLSEKADVVVGHEDLPFSLPIDWIGSGAGTDERTGKDFEKLTIYIKVPKEIIDQTNIAESRLNALELALKSLENAASHGLVQMELEDIEELRKTVSQLTILAGMNQIEGEE